jgi:3-hydroxybutyryl-CoA dehydratase
MKYYIGQKASFSKTISESDVYLFAGISGDFNSLHINKVEAEKSQFGERIVPGILTVSLISTVLGTIFPGNGTIYLEQNAKFIKPVKIGDTLTAIVEMIDINGNRAILKTDVVNQNKILVLEGSAKIKLP